MVRAWNFNSRQSDELATLRFIINCVSTRAARALFHVSGPVNQWTLVLLINLSLAVSLTANNLYFLDTF